MTQFDRPDAGGGDQFVNEQNVGNLLVLQVHDAVRGLQTENGLADVIRADVHVIGPEGGGTIRESFLDTYVFGKVIFGQLRQKIGRTVVGILEGQPGVKVQGKNVPYRLNGEIPPQAEQAAVRAMATRPDPHPQQQQQRPAAGSSWGTPPAGQQGGPSPWEQQQQPQPGPWGQQPAGAPNPGPAGGWGAPPPQQPAPGPWGQQPLPAAPPAQQPQQQPAAGPWGAPPPAPWEQPAAAPGGAPPY